jgi:ubiquitin carboxyl-terminal hydrolase 4/11/15
MKMAIGKFQPMFKGYHQHDSSELITFLLDGLHEDLNRVVVKPYVESPDSDGRSDFEVAKLSWEGFTQRNRSIIVDLMYGQYKSTLKCPNANCERISITFDPFNMVSLSVPSTKKKFLSYQLYSSLLRSEKKTIPFEKGSTQTIDQFL